MAGKVIAITGANGGFGRALSRLFAASGDQVVMLGRSLAKVEQAAAAIGGSNLLPLACDLGDAASIGNAFAAIRERHGRLDVLINNAGSFLPFLIDDASEADIISGINANLVGPILCARAAVPLMRRGGQLIHVTSESVESHQAMLSIYQAGKAGLERFSRSMVEELAPRGIRSIIFRAGQMHGEGMSTAIDPAILPVFSEQNAARGINPVARGFSGYASAAQIMRNIVELPLDISIDIVSCHSLPGEFPIGT